MAAKRKTKNFHLISFIGHKSHAGIRSSERCRYRVFGTTMLTASGKRDGVKFGSRITSVCRQFCSDCGPGMTWSSGFWRLPSKGLSWKRRIDNHCPQALKFEISAVESCCFSQGFVGRSKISSISTSHRSLHRLELVHAFLFKSSQSPICVQNITSKSVLLRYPGNA